ncbi:MAG: PPC domain-containing DNA-binding protein [Gemmatimonadales bacterium]
MMMELQSGSRRWTLVFETGEEVIETLAAFASREGVHAAHFTALGALRTATLAYFDWDTKEYRPIPVDEQVEVTSLVGDIGVADDRPAIHAHAVLGRRDGGAVTGHLLRGTVRPTLELFLDEGERPLHRRPDAESGLALIRP